MKIKGHLYGHYDSRGGATFVAAPERAVSDAIYANTMIWDEPGIADGPEEVQRWVDADYLGTAELKCAARPEEGEDLEYRPEGDPNKLWIKKGLLYGGIIQDHTSRFPLAFGPECPEGYEESELGEDACGVLFFSAKMGEAQ